MVGAAVHDVGEKHVMMVGSSGSLWWRAAGHDGGELQDKMVGAADHDGGERQVMIVGSGRS
jgi:hypothetical protein